MKGDISLSNFFIFNSSYGSNEGEEHKKILYYFPENDDLDVQIKNIGLVEAIIQFTGTFKPSCPVNSLHTQKKRQLYFQPEEGFWMVMTLTTPFIDKTKDGTSTREYIENDIQDNIYQAVLKQTYSIYKLFNGSFSNTLQKSDIPTLKSKLEKFYVPVSYFIFFSNTLQKSDIPTLKSKLEKFYVPYLKSLKLTHCDILNIFNGIQFLPLDKQNFLNVQCFLNEVECDNPLIDSTLFMFNDHVIWSGLEPDDLQTLYQYLVHIFLPSYMETELQGGSMPRNPSSPFAMYHGRFINGPQNLKTAKVVGKFPKIYLNLRCIMVVL
ncbi:Intu longin-like domain 2 [Popillia japonica]|uniref:Intu longin-like domain 2 n=1 Tax=Popillia japonica TaxID=7064 RepID=A0AAW1JX62_POPJA